MSAAVFRLTDAGVPAAARLGAGHAAEEDLQLRVQQRHVFPSEDLRHQEQPQRGGQQEGEEAGNDFVF